ncbi:DNA-binding response regulator [Luteitalea sp. TBR-22]|uniref:response regulator transcription factor n=1 Tax=Luteitalea sp. TBR-22 TaxID=2802971 RepID=UPI001AF5496A|nr:response regulator [Luteitalea sp. TBR-22]BCS30842.1 DNA-binding response regulator [Luteitalea sp. TBR-22]
MARILVVEDEPGIALALEDDLRLEGHDVEVTGDGTVAIRKARETAFDLILLDIMLAGKDGFDVVRELRRTKVMTPIVMLTARTQDAEKVLAFESGADDYVTKPFSPRELRARIAAHLRRAARQATPSTTLRIGDAEVDFDRGEVRRAGTVTPLTPLEFKLLQVFAAAKGRILTRDQLISGAWGPGTFVSDRVVDNHIGSLRRKLEPEADEPRHLLNVRGLGYRLDA